MNKEIHRLLSCRDFNRASFRSENNLQFYCSYALSRHVNKPSIVLRSTQSVLKVLPRSDAITEQTAAVYETKNLIKAKD